MAITAKTYLVGLVLVGVSMFLLGQAQVRAGAVSGQDVTDEAAYEFTDCRRPVMAPAQIHDRDSYLAAIDGYNAVVEEVNAYQTCIRREAEADIETQTALITNAYERESEAVRVSLGQMRESVNAWSRR